MKKWYRESLKCLIKTGEYAPVPMKKIVGIFIALAKTIDYEINAVADYILKKYEIH